MIKRPLFILGALAVCASLILVRYFDRLWYPDTGISDGEKQSFECRISGIEERSGTVLIHVKHGRFKLLLAASGDLTDINALKTGNVILADCTYKEWNTARNEGNFDEKSYYRSLGFFRKYKLNSFSIISDAYSPVHEAARSFRMRLSASILECADAEIGGILDAMVTGRKEAFDGDVRDLFQLSGISHVVAISGLHISFIGMGLFRMLRRKMRFRYASVISILVIACYCLMSGGSASSVRACLMMAVNLGAAGLGRKYDMLSSLSLAALLLLISNPYYVTNSGFILSFTAILSMAVLAGPVSDFASSAYIKDKEGKRVRTGPKGRAARAAAVSLSVSAATIPIIISMFYEYPLYAPVCNVLVLAAMPYILGGALAGGIAGILSISFGKILMGLPVFLTRAVMLICRIFTLLPGSNIVTGKRSMANVILYYCMIIIAILLARKIKAGQKRIKSISLRLAAIFAAYIFLLLIISVKKPFRELEITFFDVGQGESILITTENNSVFLIDAGSSTIDDVYENRLKSALHYKGIDRIDHMIITHPDTDHVSGVIEMLDGKGDDIHICNLLIADFKGDPTYDKLAEQAAMEDVDMIRLKRGMVIHDGKTELECLHPFEGKSYEDKNEKSAVMLLKHGRFRALFTGDISSAQESDLLDNGLEGMHVDLLDVAHHGSRYSSCTRFIESLDPDFAAISAGVSNSYGHPHKETITRLNAQNTDIYCTKDIGQIWFAIDGYNEVNVGWLVHSKD